MSSLRVFIEKEISDALIPKLRIRSINSLDRLLTLLEVFNKILSATIEEEEVTVKSFLLLDLLRVTTKMIQDNKIYLETVERLLAKHEERWQKSWKNIRNKEKQVKLEFKRYRIKQKSMESKDRQTCRLNILVILCPLGVR